MNKKKIIFLSARIHPGETVGSFKIQGLIDFLISRSAVANFLRDKFIFKIIPMLNPDGVVCGNYRCSLAGCDLNRVWKETSKVYHPIIYKVKKLIVNLGFKGKLSLFCDFHGHSKKKDSFIYGCNNKVQPLTCREFPYIFDQTSKYFNYNHCNFSVQKNKEGTSRVSLFHSLKLPNIFTHETSFCGPSQKVIDDGYFPEFYQYQELWVKRQIYR